MSSTEALQPLKVGDATRITYHECPVPGEHPMTPTSPSPTKKHESNDMDPVINCTSALSSNMLSNEANVGGAFGERHIRS